MLHIRMQCYTLTPLCFVLASGVVFNDVYTASKFAMEGFCESMAVQLLKFNVRYINLYFFCTVFTSAFTLIFLQNMLPLRSGSVLLQVVHD